MTTVSAEFYRPAICAVLLAVVMSCPLTYHISCKHFYPWLRNSQKTKFETAGADDWFRPGLVSFDLRGHTLCLHTKFCQDREMLGKVIVL